MHNAERTSHSGLGIVAKEMLYQSRASAWCASVTHLLLGVHSICKRHFQFDYIYLTSSGQILKFVHLRGYVEWAYPALHMQIHMCLSLNLKAVIKGDIHGSRNNFSTTVCFLQHPLSGWSSLLHALGILKEMVNRDCYHYRGQALPPPNEVFYLFHNVSQ